MPGVSRYFYFSDLEEELFESEEVDDEDGEDDEESEELDDFD
jgi:hypothetical protein